MDHSSNDQRQYDDDNDSEGKENYSGDQNKQSQETQQNRPEDELQYVIINEISKSEKKGNYQDKISQELEQKLKGLKDLLKGKNQQEILNIRMHQLAVSKILVFTHGKHQFRLVQAHFHLGEAYLNFKCYEQAIDHLTVSLKKNGKLFDIKQTKIYHSYILTSLGRCYFEIGSFDDALQLLNKAKQIQSTNFNDNESKISNYLVNSTKTLVLISNCLTKKKQYKNAMNTLQKVIYITIAHLSQQSQQCAMAYVQKSKIFALQQNYKQAQKFQNKAIEILIEINYSKPEFVAQLYQVLGGYQQKLGDIQGYQTSLQKVKTIYQQIYAPTDKRVIKTKRQISIVLLKNEKYKQALNQLHQTLDLQEKVYGESSIQVAKTLKIIGTIYLTINEVNQSQSYLKRSQKIFAQNGQVKNANQIKTKLKYAKDVKENKRPPLKLHAVKQDS